MLCLEDDYMNIDIVVILALVTINLRRQSCGNDGRRSIRCFIF